MNSSIIASEEVSNNNDKKQKQQPPTVCVIGCGPSGLSLLHATAIRKLKMEEENDVEGLTTKLPIITCFERSSIAGGVWSSLNKKEEVQDQKTGISIESDTFEIMKNSSDVHVDDDDDDGVTNDEDFTDNSSNDNVIIDGSSTTTGTTTRSTNSSSATKTNMYEALWTNGPKECIEYFDYTYDEHFNKRSLPVYMRRSDLLDYMMTRVTRNNPDFFQKSVRFNTSVVNVVYDDTSEKKHKVCLMNILTQERYIEYFDKIVWAAGRNGVTKIPTKIHNLLNEGKFLGLTLHSSVAGGILNDFQGKEIVMIGDSYSAEDLALQAVKLGVKYIHIIPRSQEGICSSVRCWPEDKVCCRPNFIVKEVINEGKGLRLIKSRYNHIHKKYAEMFVEDDGNNGEIYDINDVAAVIYCTGYEENKGMIISSSDDDEDFDDYNSFELPEETRETWRMKHNVFTPYLGDVKPCKLINTSELKSTYGFHFGVSSSNPNLIYLSEVGEFPLFEIDVLSWLTLKELIGEITPKSKEQRDRIIHERILEAMDIPCIRGMIDDAYRQAIAEAERKFSPVGDIWDFNFSGYDYEAYYMEHSQFIMKYFGQLMRAADYPVDLLKGDDELNSKGILLCWMDCRSYCDRIDNKNPPPDDEKEWRTFRDTKDPSAFKSIHTGVSAIPLKKRWIDLKDSENII